MTNELGSIVIVLQCYLNLYLKGKQKRKKTDSQLRISGMKMDANNNGFGGGGIAFVGDAVDGEEGWESGLAMTHLNFEFWKHVSNFLG